jgi:hypothetical protein
MVFGIATSYYDGLGFVSSGMLRPASRQTVTEVSGGHAVQKESTLLEPIDFEVDGNAILKNVANRLPVDMASHTGKLEFLTTLAREPQILCVQRLALMPTMVSRIYGFF